MSPIGQGEIRSRPRKRQKHLIVVEHGSAVHGGARVPRAELVEAVEHRTVVADVEVVQTFRETLDNEKKVTLITNAIS